MFFDFKCPKCKYITRDVQMTLAEYAELNDEPLRCLWCKVILTRVYHPIGLGTGPTTHAKPSISDSNND